MKQIPQVEYTATFHQLANQLIDYQAECLGEIQAIDNVQKTINSFEALVKEDPLAPPISTALLALGIQSIREHKANGLRLFYQVIDNENVSIQCRVIASQQQNIEKQLLNHCILNK
ncbi:hypothetical protein [Motilimonas eburnea]|uniref:hypothetical protein n=1 Tax=Motilimonas eburnea TaxID=1737488 RepID=UPI001E32E178|nr:hypothetical protein [Motilimonas eburnea]MCE2571830.1 hypothetical protein [Motilimonas eburnea]